MIPGVNLSSFIEKYQHLPVCYFNYPDYYLWIIYWSFPFRSTRKQMKYSARVSQENFSFHPKNKDPQYPPSPKPPGNSHAHPTCKCIVILHSSEPIAVCGDNYDLIILTNRVPRPLSFSEFFLSWKNISKEILAHNGIHYKLTSDRYIKLILSSFLFTLSNLKSHFDMYF